MPDEVPQLASTPEMQPDVLWVPCCDVDVPSNIDEPVELVPSGLSCDQIDIGQNASIARTTRNLYLSILGN